jgi:undecaprenyl-diphosphatase
LSFLQILVLAIVQGVTEFLPISSSGHLILVPVFTDWPDQGLAIDAASHLGTLAAVLSYFWRDVVALITGFFRLVTGRRQADGSLDRWGVLALYIVIGTIPVVIAGFLIDRYIGGGLRQLEIIAWTLPLFGIVLYLADRFGRMTHTLERMRIGHAVTIGLAQALALIPGVSRSGVTMVTARALGFQRVDAARFSFLLSIPATAGAGLLKAVEIYRTGSSETMQDAFVVVVLTAIAGILAIAFLMRWLRRATFTPFVIYRLALGAVLLWMVYA